MLPLIDEYWNVVVPDMWKNQSRPEEMEFVRGNPWRLFFKKIGNAEKKVNIRIHNQFVTKSLNPVETDEIFVCQLVCAKKKGVWFRGFISNVVSHQKVSVFDMDRGDIKEIDRTRLYEWPQSIKSIPLQVVICSLVPDDSFSQELWCDELQSHFNMTMLECIFEVKLKRNVGSEQELHGDEFEGLRFFASVKGMSNFYSDVVDFNDWLLERLLPELKENPKGERSGEAYLKALKQANPFEPALQTDSNLQNKSPEHTEEAKQEFPCLKEKCNAYIELDQPEDEDDSFLDFNNLYQPREHDYCHLNAKLGYCPKPLCDKKHPPRSSRWTEDKIQIEMALFNYAVLPSSGANIRVKVLSVVSSRTIYVDLGDPKYSDIGEMSGRFETFQHLDESLNDMKSYLSLSCLNVLPCIGELVIALDPNDNRFKRGRVVNLSEYLCNVFLIDFGTYIKVKLSSLMHIPQKYLHLPQQAILTHLVGLKDNFPEEDPEKIARFLEKFVGHDLYARVIDSDLIESILTVRLTAQA